MGKSDSIGDRTTVQCDGCGAERSILRISAERAARKHGGKYPCASCIAKNRLLPQNKSSYWTAERRRAHGKAIRESRSYYAALPKRNEKLKGQGNPMFGKKLSAETRAKMSKSRTGKLGPEATGWKGGKLSLCRRVKLGIHRRYQWYKRVYERDGWKCVNCGSKEKLDAHHVRPISKLIRELTKGATFESDEAKIEWLLTRPEIRDDELKNGMTLCRNCHKMEHNNWGSHYG